MAPLIALGLSLLPSLTRLVAGDGAGQVAASVATAVRDATGTDDPAAAQAVLAGNPAAATQLRTRLAEIALDAERLQAESAERARRSALEAMRAELADLAGARGAMVGLAGGGSVLAWGPALVSGIVTTGFFAMIALFLVWTPAGDNQQAWALLNIAIGALVAGFTAVINFWIGSSQGSRDKDETVRRLAGEAMGRGGAGLAQGMEAAAGAAARSMGARVEAAMAGLVDRVRALPDAATPPAPARSAAQPPGGPASDTRFLSCIAILLRQEGGFVNDPQDPGGATNLGITAATLAAWRGAPVTEEEVRHLTEEEAREIYRARYWNRLRCDDLPAGLDLMVFDMGVNAGPGVAARLLQRALGVAADGAIGPVTLAAARAAGAGPAIDRMARLREEHYRGLDGFPRFGRGWLRRTDEVRRAAQAMAAG